MPWTALLLALAGMQAAAQSWAPPQQPPKVANGADKVVCRVINVTGSRILGDRVCKTRSAWEADADQNRDDFEHRQQRPSGNPYTPTGPN